MTKSRPRGTELGSWSPRSRSRLNRIVPSVSWPGTEALREVATEDFHGLIKALSSYTLVFSHSSWRGSASSSTTVYPFSPGIPEQTGSVHSPGGVLHHSWVHSVKCLSCLGLVNDPSPVGAKASWPSWHWARPIAAARGSLGRSSGKFDHG